MQNPGSPQSSFPRSPSDIATTLNSDRPTRPTPNTAAMQPQRSSTMSSSHSYSRSSPAAGPQQQPFVPSMGTPESTRYPTSSARYYPQTPTGAPSQSPLALADIRPNELHMGGLSSPTSSYVDYTGQLSQTASSYLAPWATYAFDWCKYPVPSGQGAGKMAICSHLEDPHNFIQILDTSIEPQEVTSPGAPSHGLDFTRIAEATCSYPVTRILWEPPSAQKQTTDLLATSGDHLRLWSLPAAANNQVSNNINRSSTANKKPSAPQKLTPLALLSNSKTPEHTAPLTSLDWNKVSPKLIITSSIDTTCTIWDIPTLTAKTQLIAHDKEVFDVRFCAGSVDTFVSCGADGSVRMFDLRSLEHSTIIYEPSEKTEKVSSPTPHSPTPQTPSHSQKPPHQPQPQTATTTTPPPLLRLAASPHDSHLLATFAQDSRIIRILDHRQPGQALLELHGHHSQINCIEWSPTRRGVLASGADDSMVLSWDLINPVNSAAMPPQSGINSTSTTATGVTSPGGASATGTSAGGGGGRGMTSAAGLSLNTADGIGQPETTGANVKGPASSWRADFEVSNLSWSPASALTNQGGDWLGVTGGRGVWGVKL